MIIKLYIYIYNSIFLNYNNSSKLYIVSDESSQFKKTCF